MLVSFKLHGGKIPYFIEHHISGTSLNNRYFGITVDESRCEYIPDTLEVFTRENFIDTVKQAKIIKETNEDVYLTEQEKETYIDNWLKARGY